MATDLGKLVYHTIEEQISSQLGEKRKLIDKHEWRKLMDMAMKQFAVTLVAIVSSVATQSMQAIEAEKKAAELAKQAVPAAPAAEAPADEPPPTV